MDVAFLSVREIAKNYSGMDEFRMFQLWHLMGEAAKLDGGDVIEVGCGHGGSGFVIATQARRSGVRDRIYLCDTFDGLVKAGPRDTLKNGEMRGPTRADVENLMRQYSVPNVIVLEGIVPDDFALGHMAITFRFAHIDVDIYQSAKDAFEWLWPRMVKGGIVVLDDYGEADCPGITELVEELLPMKDALWFLHGGLQAIAVRR